MEDNNTKEENTATTSNTPADLDPDLPSSTDKIKSEHNLNNFIDQHSTELKAVLKICLTFKLLTSPITCEDRTAVVQLLHFLQLQEGFGNAGSSLQSAGSATSSADNGTNNANGTDGDKGGEASDKTEMMRVKKAKKNRKRKNKNTAVPDLVLFNQPDASCNPTYGDNDATDANQETVRNISKNANKRNRKKKAKAAAKAVGNDNHQVPVPSTSKQSPCVGTGTTGRADEKRATKTKNTKQTSAGAPVACSSAETTAATAPASTSTFKVEGGNFYVQEFRKVVEAGENALATFSQMGFSFNSREDVGYGLKVSLQYYRMIVDEYNVTSRRRPWEKKPKKEQLSANSVIGKVQLFIYQFEQPLMLMGAMDYFWMGWMDGLQVKTDGIIVEVKDFNEEEQEMEESVGSRQIGLIKADYDKIKECLIRIKLHHEKEIRKLFFKGVKTARH